MKIIVYYNRNLKMSEGKLAAQVGHVCRRSGIFSQVTEDEIVDPSKDTIVVLGLRQNKFKEKLDKLLDMSHFGEFQTVFVQKDLGLTEVEVGTITAFGYVE